MSQNTSQIAALTTIRCYAILWIAIFHMHFIALPIDHYFFTQLMRYTYVCLDMFFILSGFIISYVYYSKFNESTRILANTGTFLLYRFGRIYPLHLIVLCVCFVGYTNEWFLFDDTEFETLFAHIFLLHGWFEDLSLSWNYPSWSVSTEWFIYLCYPLLAYAIFKIRTTSGNLFMYSICIVFICLYVASRNNFHYAPLHQTTYLSWKGDILRAMLDFTLGMVMCNLYRLKFIESLNHNHLCTVLFIALFAGIFFNVPEYMLLPLLPWVVFSLTRVDGKIMRLVFTNKPAYILGDASYSLYLWHIPVLQLVWRYMADDPDNMHSSYALLPPLEFIFYSLSLLIVISILSNYVIEKPFRRLTKKMTYMKRKDNT